MAFATFSGPVRSGTVKEGAARNTGVLVLAQSARLAFGTLTGSAFILPAGSMITRIIFHTTTVFSAATTLKLSIGATDITAAVTVTTVGNHTLTLATTTGAMALVSNVGTTDATVTYTLAGAGLTTGAGDVIIEYMQRGSDGAQFPASA